MRARVHLAWIVLCAATALLSAAEEQTPFVRLYDTGAPSKQPLTGEALAGRAGWKLVPEKTLTHRFSGDAVLANGRLAVVVRGGGIDVYSITPQGTRRRASLACLAGQPARAGAPEALTIVENTLAAAGVAVRFATQPPSVLRLRLTMAESILDVRPRQGGAKLQVACRARYVVVPNYFADDMLFGLAAGAEVGLPAESFFLKLLEGGDGILMCVWRSAGLRASARITRVGKASALCTSRIDCVKGQNIWLAFLEGKGLWYGGKGNSDPRKAPDGWRPPYPAKWRCSRGAGDGPAVSCPKSESPL